MHIPTTDLVEKCKENILKFQYYSKLKPTIKQKLHNCIVMNKMEYRHRIMLISDVNSEIGDIQTILNKLKVEIDQCNYFCSHSHIKI